MPLRSRHVRVGILTGGGDCPGLNAVIRAIVRKAVKAEAAALQDSAANDAKTTVQVWAQAAVKVPINGVVLEQNIVPGDIVSVRVEGVGELSNPVRAED